ncbi:MAG: tyrosine-type recombinase/integrase [Bacteroidota bacterium]
MGHSIKPSVHAHLDSYRRPLDGKSKFSIRVDIGGNKKLYPIDTQGDAELYMDRKYWVNEKCPDTGKKLKSKRIQHSKGNGDSKGIERVLNAKIIRMEKLIAKLADADKAITHDLLMRMWYRKDSTRFSDWMEKWYEGYATDMRHKDTTVENYELLIQTIREFEDYNGMVKVSQTSVDWLKQFQTWMYREFATNEQGKVSGKGYSDTNGARKMRQIGTAIKHAFLEGEIFANVYQEFRDRGFYQSEETSIGLFLEPEEVERLQEAYDREELVDKILTKTGKVAIQGRKMHQRLGMYLFACYTGLRYGDLRNLANGHPDVTISRNTITVIMEKTGKMLRLKINDRMRSVANLTGEGPVFGTKILNNGNSNKDLRRICEMVGINKHLTMHGLRRTFATLLLNMGERMKVVSALVGHSSVTTTEQHYAQLGNKAMQDAMDRFDNTFTDFTKPDVMEFVQDVFRLMQENPDMKVPRRMADKIDALSKILNLHELETVDAAEATNRIKLEKAA